MIRNWIRSTVVAASAVAVMAGSAGAQPVFNFSTQGQFTSGAGSCNTAVLTVAICADPGSTLTLTFTGQAVNALNYGNNSTVTLGNFSIAGTGSVDALPGDVGFTLYINQTIPSAGTNSTVGSIWGSITRDLSSATGGLIWQPSPQVVVIGDVRYNLIFESVNGELGVAISAASNSTVEAVGTVVPEPSTYALMAAGLAGMGVVARRRRRSV
jgi:hypothetical protein